VFLIRWVRRTLIMLVVLLAVPLIAGELIARKLVGDAVGSAISSQFGGSPHVSFGSTPLLWQIVGGRLDDVSVSEPEANIVGLPPARLHANFDDVELSSLIGLHGVIGTVAAQANLDPQAVRDLLESDGCVRSLPPSVIAALSRDPRVVIVAGHIAVLPRRGRGAELRFVPSTLGSTIALHLTGVLERGVPVSSSELDVLASQADCLRNVSGLPFALTLVSARAVPGDLELSFAGRRATFSAA
jgi:hypothetical protein